MHKSKTKFYCFSPGVMLATFALEFGLFIFVLWRYQWSKTLGTIAGILALLAVFQISEYFVCSGGGFGLDPRYWSIAGFLAITFLPSLGLLLMFQLAKKTNGPLIGGSFLTAVMFAGFFLLNPGAFTGFECSGNYVIFQLGDYVGIFYSIFYSVWLLITLLLGFEWLFRDKTIDNSSKKAVTWLIVGYFSFMLPTAIAININPLTTAGVPSIMCGFAILFALMLVFAILPKVANKK